jgi:transposase
LIKLKHKARDKSMRVYEKEFKEEAVKLANEIGVAKAAQRLNIAPSTLSGWKKPKRQENTFDKSIPLTPREVKLMKEIKELEKANEILKEALGFFAKSRKK